jgi:hypothetical protein
MLNALVAPRLNETNYNYNFSYSFWAMQRWPDNHDKDASQIGRTLQRSVYQPFQASWPWEKDGG